MGKEVDRLKDSRVEETLDASALERLEPVCRDFEAAWKRGDRPRLEAALLPFSGRERTQLLRELLSIEIEHRERRGESPSRADYLARFLDDLSLVEETFRQKSSSPRPAEIQKPSAVPQTIGSYCLQELIGKGGMGEVYLADQKEPVRRRVALKLIKLGMDTKEVVARFEAERQALALMDHPNIARVYDAGATQDGRPYFVMEYVQGAPVDKYCDRHKIPIRERLEIFLQVCQAVQHAHHRGIIHRDLKPSNILVTTPDEGAVAKVIDFGVAKATNQRLTEKTLYTELGRVIGTPSYMSPEQAEMSSENIDTRTDIYSLGVILYELLVGELPFDWEALSNAAYSEIVRRIREDDPPTPSTRWTGLNLKLTSDLASRRRSNPRAILEEIRGDLDWICMKAMDKERERRYATAAHLADDLKRYLKDEPVEARPPSVLYKLQKFTRRHRVPVINALVIFVLLVSLISAAWYVQQAAYRRLLQDARTLLASGRLGEAEKTLGLLEKSYSLHPEVVTLSRDLEKRRQEEAERQSEEKLKEGEAAFAKFFEQRKKQKNLIEEWRNAREVNGTWRPPWETEEERRLFHDLDQSKGAVELYYNPGYVALVKAFELAPHGTAMRQRVEETLAQVFLGCFEEESIALSPEFFLASIKSLGKTGPLTNRIRLESEPGGAKIYCFRYENFEELLLPIPFHPKWDSVGEPFLKLEKVLENEKSPFQPGDRFLEVNGQKVRVRGDLARALKSAGKELEVPVKVRRAGKEILLNWKPYPEGKYAEPCTPGRLINILDQFGFLLEGQPLEFLDACLVGTAGEGSPLDLELPPGSYLLVLRKDGYRDARYQVLTPRRVKNEGSERIRLLREGKIPEGFLHIPAGSFSHGWDTEAMDTLPKGETWVKDFFISHHEVTVDEWLKFINDPEVWERTDDQGQAVPSNKQVNEELANLKPPREKIEIVPRWETRNELFFERITGDKKWRLPTRVKGRWPIFKISQFAAIEYAHWFSRMRSDGFRYRLPSDIEWEKAARGADRRIFVWGNYPMFSYCSSKLGNYSSRSALSEVGSFPLDESVYGVKDMAGSVREWTSDRTTTRYRYISYRGGSWYTTEERDHRISNRNGLFPEAAFIDSGFRLVAD